MLSDKDTALAVPAAPIIHSLKQADGTEFQAKQWGDEWQGGWETLDGYTILYDEHSNNWVYAKQDISGRTTGSDLIVGKGAPFGISRHPRLTDELARIQRQRVYVKSTPSTGTVRVPVVLINFSDTEAEYGSFHFQELLFGINSSVPTGPGSMSEYYSEVSYGNLSLSGEVEGWVTADHEHDYYGEDVGQGQRYGRSGELVKEAVQKVDGNVDFSQYDNDGDGYVDCVMVVHQGTSQSTSGNTNDIWSHKWSLRGSGAGVYYTNDGVTVNSYTIQPEKINSSMSRIGVFCHEFGHVLGLPDLYDIDGSSDGIGKWGLMSGGSWNTTSRTGDTPAHPVAWCKWFLGWVSPTQVKGLRNDEPISQVETGGDVYQFLNNPGGPGDWNRWGGGSGEYFLVENRQRLGFDAGLPGSGLLIWHIDESQGDNSNEAHRLVGLETADGKNDLDNPNDWNKGDGGDPFPGSSNNRAFNDSSNPNSKLYDGSASGVSVTEISDSRSVMRADFFVPQENQSPNTPSNPSPADGATNQSIDVDLSWNGGDPDSGDTVTYDVYLEANDSNFSEPVSPGQSGTTYDPGTLSYDTHYYWKIVATDNHGASTEGPVWDFITGSRPNNSPNTPSAPSGPDTGNPGTSYTFSATTTDPDGDRIAFKFRWGDGSESPWTSFVDSGASASKSHSWSDEGTYEVKVKAKDNREAGSGEGADSLKAKARDPQEAESGWSSAHQIVISEGRHENEIFSLPAGKWKMISIPFTLDDPGPNAVLVDDLGAQNDTVWKLYRWNTAKGSYDKYPYTGDFAPGKSLYIISRDAKEVDTGPGTDVSRETNFVINLPSGWSQIGNPFPFSVAWGEVRVRKDSEVVSISEAQARGWVRDKIWSWDGDSYIYYPAPGGELLPYEGHWVKALLDCELLVPPNGAQGAKVFEQVIKPKEEFLQVKARVGNFEDSYNFLGFYQTAKDGYDTLDVEEAPAISPYISLFFPHPEWGKNKGDYTQDIRTQIPQTTKWIWDFEVKTDQINQEIVLEWENTLTFSQELHLYLTDSFSNVLANMREKSSYSFISSSGLESFKIIVSSETLPLPEELHLSEIYSYPNPAHGEGVKFHFHLASSAQLTIRIYSISGELVRTLVKDKAYFPGAYEEFWEEDSDRGERLARGLYIFIIQAGNPAKKVSKSGKIVLLD